MTDPLAQITTRATPQSQPADPRQKLNAAGGYAFTLDEISRVHRFLILGTLGGTYYATERQHTLDNAELLLAYARDKGVELVDQVVAVSQSGRAPKQQPCLFALAAVAKLGGAAHARKHAFEAVPLVCRTGTHLFTFAKYLEQFGGWGRGTRRAIAEWYTQPDLGHVAYQAVKYRQREGWSHRDLLRNSHPKLTKDEAGNYLDPGRHALFEWIVRPDTLLYADYADDGLSILDAFTRLQAAQTPQEVFTVIHDHPGVTWEMIPDAFMNEKIVWEGLLTNRVPQTALIRQLPRLTRIGVFDDRDLRTLVAGQLVDEQWLHKGRVHPVNVLTAQRTYVAGHSFRGSSVWTPDTVIVDALDTAFYASFKAVEPTGKRLLIALDVSGSMGSQMGDLPLTVREASAAMALASMKVESDYTVIGFSDGQDWAHGHGRMTSWISGGNQVAPLTISPRQRLDDVVNYMAGLRFGGTDCALPMLYAAEHDLAVDAFVIYTDNETWFGSIHPHQALADYRRKTGIPAKLIVAGMTATEFSIADPTDPGSLDVVGFDAAVPNLVADFIRGL